MDLIAFLSSFECMVAITVVWIVFHLWLERSELVWKYAQPVAHACNFMYSIANVVALIWGIKIFSQYDVFQSVDHMYCSQLPSDPKIDEFLFIYYLSKIYEFIDIILCLLRSFPLHPHFRFHHATTLSLAWTILVAHSSHGVVFALLNIFMHSLLYLFLAGSMFKVKALHYSIWTVGHIQLLWGIIGSSAAIYQRLANGRICSGTLETEAWGLFLYLSYFALFRYELSGAWQPPKRPTKQA